MERTLFNNCWIGLLGMAEDDNGGALEGQHRACDLREELRLKTQ